MTVHVPAKADYGVRAAVELARRGEPTKCRDVAHAQDIPLKFLVNILSDLRRARIVRSQRGAEGGYWLVREADKLTVAEVMEAVMGPLTTVGGAPPEALDYPPGNEALARVWAALDTRTQAVLGGVTIADLVRGDAS
ncbi:RrF2 family transcriptional regulator [Amycolatopsis thermoflava]|uniref:RrF2 family transcriptional regulator n=1 Tax=Amycolatopsis thermoflava TaxID=84480 RepID=UPI00364D8EC0